MDVDIDSNQGGDDFIVQIIDDRFYLVVFIPKTGFAATIRTLESMSVGDEVPLGRLRSGPKVWLIRDASDSYAVAVGDPDSKDVSYTLPAGALTELCNTRPA